MNLKQALNFSAAVSAALSAIIVASCDDRLTVPGYVEADGYVKFGVTVTEPWSNGHTAASRAADDVRIEPTVTETGDTLYLVTRVQSCNDSIVTLADLDKIVSSRGNPVNDKAEFWKSFGVTAIVSGGDTYNDEDNVSGRRIADNETITGNPSTDSWYVPQALAWPAAGETRFCAYAPHSNEAETLIIYDGDSDSRTGTPVLRYTVPTDIKDQIDLMYCVTDPLTESDNAVALSFRHALAAVTVKCQGMLPGSVTKVTVSGIYGSGTFSFIPDESGAQWTFTDTDTPESSYEFTFEESQKVSDSEVTILDGEMTLLVIPQSLGSDAKIQFEYTDEFSGIKHLLSAAIGGEGKSWKAGNKYNYSLSTSSTIFTPVCEDFKIEDYGAYDEKTSGDDELKIGNEVIKCKGMIPVSGILEKVSLKAGFQTSALGDDNSVMTKNVKADYLNETDRQDPTKPGWWFTYATGINSRSEHKSAKFYPLEDDVVVAVAEADQSLSVQLGRLQFEPQSEWVDKLKLGGDEVGAAGEYYDLSTAGGTTESSNCYVINAPGYYKLPLVYGNSLGHPEVLEGKSGTTDVWSRFKDHNNIDITEPAIKDNGYTPHDCVLMWQDSPGLITDVELAGDYLTFRARPESFAQGNAVVAVRDDSGTVLWSWHIWATNYYKMVGVGDELYSTTAKGTNRVYQFGPSSIGYCDPHGEASERTMTLSLYVHFRMPDGTETDITVFENKELTQEALQESVAGDNTFYQWGRKDPMLGSSYYASLKDYGAEVTWVNIKEQLDILNKRYYPGAVRFKRVESRKTIAYTIGHPNEFVLGCQQDPNDYRRHWRDGGKVINAWDVNMSKEATGATTGAIPSQLDTPYDPEKQLKSIYDPSPRGYRVPPINAFSGFVKQGDRNLPEDIGMDVDDYACKVSCDASSSGKKMSIPLTGLRDVGPHGGRKVTIDGVTKDRLTEYDAPLTSLLALQKYNRWTFTTAEEDFDYTWPAHRKVSFIATTTLTSNTSTNNSDQTLIFYVSQRTNSYGAYHAAISINGYGFTVRPVKGMSMGL